MVNYSFQQALELKGISETELSDEQRQEIWQIVYEIWALPSLNDKTPPPHSTGAAVDVTIVDNQGKAVDMGSPIDELSERSHPNYYANQDNQQYIIYHKNRQILYKVMIQAGFQRNPREWWHFSLGDQMWAWLNNQEDSNNQFTARYGRI